MNNWKIDLGKVPLDPLEGRAYLLREALTPIMALGVEYLQVRFGNRRLLEQAIVFLENDMLDAPRSDITSLSRTGFVPIVEAVQALDESLSHALLGHYKSSIDSQRRALEIVLVGAYFVSSCCTCKQARAWMDSTQRTPFVTRMVEELGRIAPYYEATQQCSWSEHLLTHYHRLCDIVHVRGARASYRERQPTHLVFGGFHVPSFSETALSETAESLVVTVQQIASIVALANPVLLAGLPITEKFGLDPPVSGFFEEAQAERLWALLPDSTRPFFQQLLQTDPEVIGVQEAIVGRPDLSDEELRRQVAEHDKWLAQMRPAEGSSRIAEV